MNNEQPSAPSRRDQQIAASRTAANKRRAYVWGISIIVVLGIGYLMVTASSNVPVPVTDGTLATAVTDQDNSKGPVDGPVTLVEYGDFQCPACGAFEPILKQLLAEPQLVGKVRVIFRHFPLTGVHQNAMGAAQAAQAAAMQGKFWEMHDKLYATQAQWSNMSDTGARALWATFAQQIGLDVNVWKKDIDSQAVKDRIQRDVDSGATGGVDATPTFYVNGRKLPPPASYDDFKNTVIAGLTASPAVSASATPSVIKTP